MFHRWFVRFALICAVASVASANSALMSSAEEDRYANAPLVFEPNHGQTDEKVAFLARCNGYNLFLTAREVVLSLRSPNNRGVSMRLVGANPRSVIEGLDALPSQSHYFIGADGNRWHSNIPNFARAAYREIYPGIDLVFYGKQRELEYDFIVAPDADPKLIRLTFAGVDNLELANGELVLHVNRGQIAQRAPQIYQMVDGERRAVEGGYRRTGRRQVGFEIAAYDKTRPLIIDPVLSFSTYLGGAGVDDARAVAVDSDGSAYVTGTTDSANFPTAAPRQAANAGSTDVFVSRFNAAGTQLIYSTYLGGSAADTGNGIAVDRDGNAFIAGATQSSNFPLANARQATAGGGGDAFIFKLSPTGGALLFSSYLGGNASDVANGLALDDSGNPYVAGITASTNFPLANPLQATPGTGFVTKLNSAGNTLFYSTYLAGASNNAIAVDSAGNAYITGTAGSGFVTTPGAFQTTLVASDAFVTKLNGAGNALAYSTLYGGVPNVSGLGIAVDTAGNAYITGFLLRSSIPLVNPVQSGPNAPVSGFVAKFNAAGSGLIYSTFLGGSLTGSRPNTAIAVDRAGNAHVTGGVASSGFPVSNPVQPSPSDPTNGYGFVTKLNAAGALVYSTFLGGGGDQGQGIALDSTGSAYVVGSTRSTNFPTANAFQPTPGGGGDAFVTKLGVAATTATLTSSENPSIFGQAITLTAAVTGAPPITGAVTFKDGATTLGTMNLNASFQATLTTSALAQGNHTITAEYASDANNGPSVSSALVQTVNAAPGDGAPSPPPTPAPSPPPPTPAPAPAPDGGGGGGCTIGSTGAFDPTLLLAMAVLAYVRRRSRTIRRGRAS